MSLSRPTEQSRRRLLGSPVIATVNQAPGRGPGDLHTDLIAYAAYCRVSLGEPIDLWPLVVQMLRTFMHFDRAFRAWRRQHLSGAAARVDGMRSDGGESG